jgi:hypothetical protein
MDQTIVCALLEGLIDGNLSDVVDNEGEPREAVRWLKQKVSLNRPDKGSSFEFQPSVQRAANAAEQAVAHWERGEKASAKSFAEEAQRHLGCPDV